MSILALGVIPYITASIIMNLLTMMYPTFMQWKKEGDAGRRKITRVTRYLTLGIALIQSFSLTVTLANQGLAFQSGPSFYFVSVVTLVTGSIFMMWLGEQITERGAKRRAWSRCMRTRNAHGACARDRTWCRVRTHVHRVHVRHAHVQCACTAGVQVQI